MRQHLPQRTLDYAGPRTASAGPRPLGDSVALGVTGAVVSYANLILTSCMCGHMSLGSLPGSLVGLSFVCAAIAIARGSWVRRLPAYLCLAPTWMIAVQNVCDVFWWGHAPLFR